MKTVIIDYGSGNLHSAVKSFQKVANLCNKGDVLVTSDPKVLEVADKVVLPGVGSFNDCLNGLKRNEELLSILYERVFNNGIPFLGICVGLQLLADYGHENIINTPGLGWLSGEVKKICPKDNNYKVPHMGWNSLKFDKDHPLIKRLSPEIDMYFVHSYHFDLCEVNDRIAHVEYSGDITAIAAKNNICGTQFHPEKSQQAGQTFIENFMDWSP